MAWSPCNTMDFDKNSAKNSIFGITEYGKRKTSFTNANLQKVFVKVFVKLVTD